jgi:hypothetical protein
MTHPASGRTSLLVAMIFLLCSSSQAQGVRKTPDDSDRVWTVLLGSSGGLDAWKSPRTNWEEVGGVSVDPKNARKFVGESGKGVFYNGPGGMGSNLVTRETFGDVEVHVEFNIPKGSNSGVKLAGVYEIQNYDRFGVKKLKGSDSGGIYPRAELLPTYHHIDDGTPPRTNASRPPGEWQTLDITFRAPRFDANGKKTENARFVKVVLNGQVVQEDVGLLYATGHAWHGKEHPTGPILLQGDHGAVAFRNMKVRALNGQ